MKIKNIITNIVFDLPKSDVDILIKENPDIYEKVCKTRKKKEAKPKFDQNTILPLIWEG